VTFLSSSFMFVSQMTLDKLICLFVPYVYVRYRRLYVPHTERQEMLPYTRE